MNLYVINKSTVLKDAQIQRWLPAFDVFADHVRAWWPRAVSLVWCPRDKEPEPAWKLVFADKSDEAGDLGYHDFTPDGRPISYVFAADLKEIGASQTVTATHEIAEMIADPWISENFQITDTRFFAKEICDPCEADEFAYSIKAGRFPAIQASDFVLPKWFIPGSTGQFDRNQKIDEPLQILPGGYMSVFTPGGGWRQIGAKKAKKSSRVAVLGNDPKKKGQFGRLTKYGRTARCGWSGIRRTERRLPSVSTRADDGYELDRRFSPRKKLPTATAADAFITLASVRGRERRRRGPAEHELIPACEQRLF